MATSPDFAQQMDHVILLCHSDAPERVLSSVVTKNVWFHHRDADGKVRVHGAAATAPVSGGADDDGAITEHEFVNDSDHADGPADTNQVKTESHGSVSLPPVRLAAVEAKSTNPAAPSIPTPKPRVPAEPVSEPSAPKRSRPALRTSSQPTAAASDKRSGTEQEEKREAEEEDTEEEVEVAADDTVTEDKEDKVAVIPNKRPGAKEHLGDLPDFLLNFDNPIHDMCYVDKRSRAQTKAFKEHLRKAIRFVDAQPCKPPPGKVCMRECKKLRDVMCARTTPYSNATCRLWHDVEVHIGRCKNTYCELRNHVVLREAMHTIDCAKQREYDLLKTEETNRDCERERLLEVTLVQNDTSELECQIAAEEEELEAHEDVVTEYWTCLNKVGIELKDDVADGLPNFTTHYASKKKPAVAKTSVDRARRSESISSTATLMPNSAVGQRTLRRVRRTSTQAMDVEVIDVDSESGENSPPNKRLVKQELGGSKSDRQNPNSGSKK